MKIYAREQKIIIAIIIIIILAGAGFFVFWRQGKITEPALSDTGAAAAPTEYFPDSGRIKAKVKNLEKRGEAEYVRLEIIEIIHYSRNPDAKHDPFQAGDEVEFYLSWGSAPKDIELDLGDKKEIVSIPGLGTGDNVEANFAGCPDGCNSGYGWSVYAYNKI
ncbi:MAG: hypothetical protein Q8L21_03595 [Candidatus Komeilibacteria bacterium]|nr:hypothetical protein [Candidatus Komeilibacteria bacterium]